MIVRLCECGRLAEVVVEGKHLLICCNYCCKTTVVNLSDG